VLVLLLLALLLRLGLLAAPPAALDRAWRTASTNHLLGQSKRKTCWVLE
jgi:hypothetical protein